MRKAVFVAAFAVSALVLPSTGFAQAVVTVPGEVETYVTKESMPSVTVEREVIVGSELPDTVVLHPVPKFDTYSYAVVNNRRVIVEAKTRKVVKVVE